MRATTDHDSDPPAGRRVYGLRVHGLDGVTELPVARGHLPGEVPVRIRQSDAPPPPPTSPPPPAPTPATQRQVVRVLADGRHLAMDRDRGEAVFFGEPLTPDLLAHPYLGPVATLFNRWAGREAFHGGAVVLDGRAWVLSGPRTAGKSTLLAALAADGVPVLTDDILVLDDHAVAYAGPRCLDLRQPLPDRPLAVRPVRNGSRWRIALPPLAPRIPLGGWFFLTWGTKLELAPLTAPELLARLAAGRSWRHLPSDPTALLALAILPAWSLTRPATWTTLTPTCRLIRSTILDGPRWQVTAGDPATGPRPGTADAGARRAERDRRA